jgi:hypothetical protein
LFGIDSSFDCAVVLFNDVVEVLHGSMFAASAQNAGPLEEGDCHRIRRCQVGVDHTWLSTAVAQCSPE